jgi:hypothetical protein
MTARPGTIALGVMQPYLFPYLGYFQYVNACDKFVLYDDVQYIMRGWINRNSILLNGEPFRFTVPLVKASPNKTIAETRTAPGPWVAKLMSTFAQAYRKAPQWPAVSPILEAVFGGGQRTIAEMAADSILAVSRYLAVTTMIIRSSADFDNAGLGRNARLMDLCVRCDARTCIVPEGGRELYGKEEFAAGGVELLYLRPGLTPYPQGSSRPFVPSLSIIDVLMWNSPAQVKAFLDDHTLL